MSKERVSKRKREEEGDYPIQVECLKCREIIPPDIKPPYKMDVMENNTKTKCEECKKQNSWFKCINEKCGSEYCFNCIMDDILGDE